MASSEMAAVGAEANFLEDPALIAAAESIVSSYLKTEVDPLRTHRKRRKQHCGCVTGEACHACHKCLEKHCTCGDPKRHRDLCLESRACDCMLVDPRARCPLCRGCQRKQGYSHCRCTQHRRQRLQRAQARVKEEAEANSHSGSNGKACMCFRVASNAMSVSSAGSGTPGDANARYKRIRRLRQSMGVPSVENIYQKKIDASLAGAHSAEEEGDEDVDVRSAFDDGVHALIHRPLIKGMLGLSACEPPYQPLYLREGSSYLESIEPRTDAAVRKKDMSIGLVDYLVHASSVKVARVGEMIGAFDDSAAVAGAIVMEEYIKQLVDDALVEKQPVLSLTKPNVQGFTTEMLKGFNWAFFYDQVVDVATDTKWNKLVSAVYEELVSMQDIRELGDKDAEIKAWIRETVEHHHSCLQAGNTDLEEEEPSAAEVDALSSSGKSESNPPTPYVRLGVRQSELLACPAYHFSLKSALAGNHRVLVSVNGIETLEKACTQIRTVKRVLNHQHERLSRDSEAAQRKSRYRVDESVQKVWQKEREEEEMRKQELEVQQMEDEHERILRGRMLQLEQKNKDDAPARVKVPRPVIWVVQADPVAEQVRVEREQLRMERQRLEAEKEQRKAERARVAAEKRCAIAEKRRLKAEKRAQKERMKSNVVRRERRQKEHRVPKWKLVQATEDVTDPAVHELFEMLRQQVRQSVGDPSAQSETPQEETSGDRDDREQQQQPNVSEVPNERVDQSPSRSANEPTQLAKRSRAKRASTDEQRHQQPQVESPVVISSRRRSLRIRNK